MVKCAIYYKKGSIGRTSTNQREKEKTKDKGKFELQKSFRGHAKWNVVVGCWCVRVLPQYIKNRYLDLKGDNRWAYAQVGTVLPYVI